MRSKIVKEKSVTPIVNEILGFSSKRVADFILSHGELKARKKKDPTLKNKNIVKTWMIDRIRFGTFM